MNCLASVQILVRYDRVMNSSTNVTGRCVSLDEYLQSVPDDDEWAREEADRYAEMTPTERFRELSLLGAWMDTILADRMPKTLDGELTFWKLWKDPLRGLTG